MWRCPICHSVLSDKVDSSNKYRTLCCDNKHSFDQARQGYFNLLPVQNKRSKVPGDDKSMVQARQAFLSQGYYDYLIEAIYQYILSRENNIHAIYDAGCGTGYYLNRLALLLNSKGASGHDISKDAILVASRAYKSIQFCVASTVNIPVVNDSQDLVLQIFSPPAFDEYERILQSDGYLVIVEPAKAHLKELKEMLYDEVVEHTEKNVPTGRFIRLAHFNVTKKLTLSSSECALNLLKMTPFYWKTNESKRELIKASLRKVTSDFSVSVYTKLRVIQ